ncbi:MAG: hypothetical protein K2Y39_17860 [Candidatus Obscuribacterales bacterium]|nr:hypothetical protein [Candidatus Obscuribacterales bacterium]
MNEISSHRPWLHTRFPVLPVGPCSDLARQQSRNNLRGRRVWSKSPLADTVNESGINIPREIGGTVVFHGTDDVFVVRWDSGLVAMHRKDQLLRAAVLIGAHESLKSYLACMRHHECTP